MNSILSQRQPYPYDKLCSLCNTLVQAIISSFNNDFYIFWDEPFGLESWTKCTDQHFHVLNGLAIIELLISWLWMKLQIQFWDFIYQTSSYQFISAADENYRWIIFALVQEDLYYPHPLVQDILWGSLHNFLEPILMHWPGKKLREKALTSTMEHIHYEDENTRYICIGPVNKVIV